MRKRLYTSLLPGEGEGVDLDAPEPEIHNIVSTAQVEITTHEDERVSRHVCRGVLDLEAVQRIMPGCSYDRARFAAMTIRFANPNCTLLLFSSGKLVVTGVRSWYDGVLSCLHVARTLQRGMPGLDFRVVDCGIQNIVAHVEVPVGDGFLNLAAMYTSLNLHCTYQDNLFPGLIYRPPASPVVLLCFYSGKIVITGGRNEDDVFRGWRRLWPVVRVFVQSGPLPAGVVAGGAGCEDGGGGTGRGRRRRRVR